MGWGNCGTDSQGRSIGYYFEAVCDEHGCDAVIDRGQAYACGGMHGDEYGCERYFCGKHLVWSDHAWAWGQDERGGFVCPRCQREAEPVAAPLARKDPP